MYGFIGRGQRPRGRLGAAACARALVALPPRSDLLLAAAVHPRRYALGPALLLRSGRGGASQERDRGHRLRRARASCDLRLVARRSVRRASSPSCSSPRSTVTLADYLFKATVAPKSRPRELGRALRDRLRRPERARARGAGRHSRLDASASWCAPRALCLLSAAHGRGAGGVLAGGGRRPALLAQGRWTARSATRSTGPSTELLFVPMPDASASGVKPFIDLVGQRGGQALASIGILALVAVGHRPPRWRRSSIAVRQPGSGS